MEREIKFRAWDGHKFYDASIVQGVDWDFMRDTPTNNPVMQFTGLKDKNGVDVYEGDILKYSSDEFNFDEGDVIFSDGCYRCRCTYFHQLSSAVMPLFKIIGNIYQNLNLLC